MSNKRHACSKCYEVVSDIVNNKSGFVLTKDILGLWEKVDGDN